jgi:L-glutamine-phosphate cytidylyltransferase
MTYKNSKVIIIAAGLGSRLRPLTKNKPKCLVKIKKKSLLDRQLEVFKKNKLNNINIIVGHKKEKLQKLKYNFFENKNYRKNNILNSLFSAKKIISGSIIISYSDIIFKNRLIKKLMSARSDISVLVDKSWKNNYKDRKLHPISEAENVVYDKKLNIKKAGKIIGKKEANGELIGLFKLSPKGSKIFKHYYHLAKKKFNRKKFYSAATFQKAYITDFLNFLIDNRVKVKSNLVSGGWMEIDTSEDLKRAERF